MFSDGSSGIAGAETGYSTLGRHAGMEHDLSANVVRAKAKMSEKVVRHEFRYFAFDKNARTHLVA